MLKDSNFINSYTLLPRQDVYKNYHAYDIKNSSSKQYKTLLRECPIDSAKKSACLAGTAAIGGAEKHKQQAALP